MESGCHRFLFFSLIHNVPYFLNWLPVQIYTLEDCMIWCLIHRLIGYQFKLISSQPNRGKIISRTCMTTRPGHEIYRAKDLGQSFGYKL